MFYILYESNFYTFLTIYTTNKNLLESIYNYKNNFYGVPVHTIKIYSIIQRFYLAPRFSGCLAYVRQKRLHDGASCTQICFDQRCLLYFHAITITIQLTQEEVLDSVIHYMNLQQIMPFMPLPLPCLFLRVDTGSYH